MQHAIHRRDLLRQGSLAIAGLAIAGRLSAAPKESGYEQFRGAGPVRLTSNENPYGPSPLARKAMADAINAANRYPWDNTAVLMKEIGKHHALNEQHVLMGAGSSEILGLVAQLAASSKGNAITAHPTFQIWIPAAERLGLQVIRVPLTADKKHNLPAMLDKLNSDTRLVYVCNPNNPTGTAISSGTVKSFIEEVSKKTMVLLDEAYIEYCNEPSLAGMVAANRNLVVAKTFSKVYGLAGARIGYALAHPETIGKLAAFQPWRNAGASGISVAAALASLQDQQFVNSSKEMTRKAGDYAIKELSSLGFQCIPSNTNFLYYSIGSFNGNWPELLRAKNILTGRIVEEDGKWTRTTIGTMEEMQAFITAAKQIV